MAWGNTPWDEASRLPGSGQVGLGKGFLERYEWWRFEPHPEWVPAATADEHNAAFAAGIPGQVRVLFLPSGVWGITVKGIEPGAAYRASLSRHHLSLQVEGGSVLPESPEGCAQADARDLDSGLAQVDVFHSCSRIPGEGHHGSAYDGGQPPARRVHRLSQQANFQHGVIFKLHDQELIVAEKF